MNNLKTLLTAALCSVALAPTTFAQSTPQVTQIGACSKGTDGKFCQAFTAGQSVNPSTTLTKINHKAALVLNPELAKFMDETGQLYGFDGYLVIHVG
jgi:hypothetical protein